VVLLVLSGYCAYFFRDFERAIPVNEALILSPADGKVMDVSSVAEGPFKGDQIVRIFLSVFDVHVQRAPVQAKVDQIEYKPGRFLDARDPRAHIENEQNALILTSNKGRVVVIQIAGFIARRIVCWMKPGDELAQGQRFGLIRFGSQVDLIVPKNVDIRVKAGDRVAGGLTVIGEWRNK